MSDVCVREAVSAQSVRIRLQTTWLAFTRATLSQDSHEEIFVRNGLTSLFDDRIAWLAI